jgi:hypothetical protein
MMWIAQQVLVLKDATMNFDLNIITYSHEGWKHGKVYQLAIPTNKQK